MGLARVIPHILTETEAVFKKSIPKIGIENRRYIGSKAKLIDWIFSNIERECKGNTFTDIFAGTGVVAAKAANQYNKVILNDFLHSNYAAYQGFFSSDSYDKEKIIDIAAGYNLLTKKILPNNYFSDNFAGKYFDKKSARLIGYIRQDLEDKKSDLNNREFHILLTSLLYSADKIANTVGHYEAYFRKSDRKADFIFKVIEPIEAQNVEIYREDANALARRIKSDIVYIDPPYNSRQYSRFYHLLETLTKWDEPKLSGVALKPPEENMSDYCRNSAGEVFKDLVNNLNTKYIVVSYNNTYNSKSSSSKNKIQLSEIEQILNEKGSTKIFRKSHQFFNSGKTDFADHQEILFITKVHGKGTN